MANLIAASSSLSPESSSPPQLLVVVLLLRRRQHPRCRRCSHSATPLWARATTTTSIPSPNPNSCHTAGTSPATISHRQVLQRQDQRRFPSNDMVALLLLAASVLGVKETLPPYLDKSLTLEDLKTGASFASAGSGYDNDTSWIASGMTVEEQLQLFMEYMVKVGSIPTRALYIINWGSNDVILYFTFANSKTQDDYTDFMTQRAFTFIQVLGVRQIAVTGVPPVGCTLAQRLTAGGLRRQCVADRNQMAQQYNWKISWEIDGMAIRFPGINLMYIDLYSILDDIVQRYQALAKLATSACVYNTQNGIICSDN
ncbi:hypothetical protein ACP4OV_003408 [Aristida adscensionis]